jgi:DNA polymerase
VPGASGAASEGTLLSELQPVTTPARLRTVDAVQSGQGPYPGDARPADQREQQLGQLAQRVAHCTRCEVLASCRNQTVFGEGSVTPRVVFFGEGPGADEDRTGRPFVGRAGQLLTKMIEACKFQRADVYILNTVKCRPPGNRNPEPHEIANCREYYQQQLAILRPEYIVCLGAVSAQELLQSKLSVGRLRGKLHSYFESKVLVTYHPAYLLRNPSAKKAAWQDLQIMLRDANIDY